MRDNHKRLAEIEREIAERMAGACGHLPEDEFHGLVRQLAFTRFKAEMGYDPFAQAGDGDTAPPPGDKRS